MEGEMKLVLVILCISLTILVGCSSPTTQFAQARASGDVSEMAATVSVLTEHGLLRQGMTYHDVVALLGSPDRSAGIFVPGGYSMGYGSTKPTVTNYHKFFWIHLRPPDWQEWANMPAVVIGWGDQ